MMRRLPIYLVIETSDAMRGEAAEGMKVFIQCLVNALCQDPYAIETAWVSVITFNEKAKQLRPLIELTQFERPEFVFSGAACVSSALALLQECVRREVITGRMDVKGDWKPIVFLLVSGGEELARTDVADLLLRNRGLRLIICAPSYTENAGCLSPLSDGFLSFDSPAAEIMSFFRGDYASTALPSSDAGRW